MPGLCTNNGEKYIQREKHLNEVYKYWNSFDAIKDTIGNSKDVLAKRP